MSRPRSKKRKKALKLWIDSGRTIQLIELAVIIGVSHALIRKWKHEDDWDEEPDKRLRGGQPGNSNAEGNSGGSGGPHGNDKAYRHGAYSRFMPQNPKFQELLNSVQQTDPLDMLWNGIEITYAKLLWSQDIMHVDGRDDHTQLTKGDFDKGIEYEHHLARNKQATDISAYATISRELRASIKQFLAIAPEDDERRYKLELMQAQVTKVNAEIKVMGDTGSLPKVTIIDDIQRGGVK